MLEKKQIRVTFLFEYKMIAYTFGPGTKEGTVQYRFRKFRKGDKGLEDEECSGWPSEVDSYQLRAASKVILLQLHKELPKNSTSTILPSFGIWSKLERWKSTVSACLMNWLQIKRTVIWSVVFSHSMQQHWTISQSNYDEPQKLDFYPTTGSDQLSGWIKMNPWTCTKKMSWSLFGGLLPVWSTTAFWIQVQALHLRSMLSKPRRCTKNCSACGQHWSTKRAQFFSTMPDHRLHNHASEVLRIGLQSFA